MKQRSVSTQSSFYLNVAASIAVLVLFSFAAIDTFAQTSANGTIYGHVTDSSGATIAGVQVVANSPGVGGTFRAVSDPQGNYRLIELPPGTDYTVTAEFQGFQKFQRVGLVVEAGLNVAVDITLQVGSQQQSVVVSGDAPLIDAQSAQQAVNLSGDLLRSVPITVRHDWSDSLQLTPGIISASSDAEGGQTYFLRGSENENHATLLDGMDIGSFEQNWPSNTISIPNEALGDIQTVTGGNEAALPAAMGMVINIASPVGSDQFHGSVFYLLGPHALVANNVSGGSSAASTTEQPDFSFGGPIKKGRAWFFVAGRYINRDDGISQTPAQFDYLSTFVPGFKAFPNQSNGFVYLGNATFQLTQRHRLEAIVQHDSRTQDANYQWYAGNYAINQYGGGAYGLRLLSSWTPNITTRFLVSYNDKGVNPTASSIGGVGSQPEIDVYATYAKSAGTLVGQGASLATLNNLNSVTLNPASKPTASGDLDYYISKAFGSHDIQTGFYLEPNERSKETTLYANGGALIQEDVVLNNPNDPADGYTPFHEESVNAASNLTSYISANDYAWYIQDRWRPVSRLVITAGLRPDWVSSFDQLFKVSTMHAWNYAPRVGGEYALTRSGKNVVRASWSKITDITNAAYLGSAGTSTVTTTNSYFENGVWVPFVTPGSTELTPGKTFDPNRHQGYVREWLVGYRTQLPGELVVDVSYIHREYRDRPTEYDTNQIYTQTATGVVWGGLVNPALNNTYFVTNDRWNWFVYEGYEVSVSKQTRQVQLFSTYTYSPDHIAGTWQPDDPTAIIQPSTFANNAGIGSVRGYVTNDWTGDTRNRMWQRHQLRNGVSWRLPANFTVATTFTAQSGTPGGPVITTVPYDDEYGPATLSIDGRTVSNPLATTYRFAYANRGIGQIWCPWLIQWNTLVGRQFKITERQSVDVSLNIYNILNGAAAQQFVNGNNIASPTFGELQNIQVPRSAQIGFRYQF